MESARFGVQCEWGLTHSFEKTQPKIREYTTLDCTFTRLTQLAHRAAALIGRTVWIAPVINTHSKQREHELYYSGYDSVGIALGYGLDYRSSRVRFPAGAVKFFSSPPRPERLWGTPSLLSNGYQGLSLGVKRPGREADHSPPSSAEVKEWVELYLHSQYAFMAWCSVK
jgi:hypothetical protein